MTDDEVAELLGDVGILKFPRAWAKRTGIPWRPGADGGAPPQWYASFRGELGDQIERALRSAC